MVKIDNVTNVEGQMTSDGDFKEKTITTEVMETDDVVSEETTEMVKIDNVTSDGTVIVVALYSLLCTGLLYLMM